MSFFAFHLKKIAAVICLSLCFYGIFIEARSAIWSLRHPPKPLPRERCILCEFYPEKRK
jgi:hypothetical protein